MTAPTPRVEVFLVTYNQAGYIRQAIDSVLAQDTPFPVRLTILEDCSTDGTREIVREYADKHPDRIRAVLHERNLNSDRPLVEAIQASPAEFVAVLEGDDWFTDPRKLRRQVAFLREYPDCALCYHNVEVVYDDDRPTHLKNPPKHPRFATVHDLFVRDFIATCSALYRRSALADIPDWYFDVDVGDWYMHLLAARHGRIVYLPEPMAAYRVHPQGQWSRLSPVEQWRYSERVLLHMRAHFEDKYGKDIDRGLHNVLQFLARDQALAGDLDGAAESLARAKAFGFDDDDWPVRLIQVVPQPGDATPPGEPGTWLEVHCEGALFATFARIDGTGLRTEFRTPQRLRAFLPERLRGQGRRLRLVDLRGESNAMPGTAKG